MDDIVITILEDDDLPQRVPAYLKKGSVKAWNSPESTNVRVVCSRRVFEIVENFSKENSKKEVGGILLGAAYRHDGNIYVEITEYVKAQVSTSEQSGVSHFTFTAQTWAEMLRVADTQYKGLKMVGWFHSHPGHTAFLSTMDLSIHNDHFKSPWHVALVYDPIRHEGGFWVWENGKIVPAGFYELFTPNQKTSTLTWKKPSRLASPKPDAPPSKVPWWKDPLEWLWGVCWLIVFGGIVLGFFLLWSQIQQIDQKLETQQKKIIALQETLVVVNKNFATATPPPTLTLTISETPTITLTTTKTLSPTSTTTPAPTDTPTITPTMTKTARVTLTSTPTISPTTNTKSP